MKKRKSKALWLFEQIIYALVTLARIGWTIAGIWLVYFFITR